MASYSIKKISNGEYREINKKFTLNVTKYRSNRSILYFNVENEKDPVLFDVSVFYNIIVEQIQKGLAEKLEYNDGVITVSVRDGNVIKNYIYDFNWKEFDKLGNFTQSALDELKDIVYKIVSIYNENPNRTLASTQTYFRMILDIIDGVRLPKIEDEEELLRIFEVYNSTKPELLMLLLQNVIFYDDNGNVLEYGKHLRAQKLKAIKYDVLSQMEVAMLMFAANNNAVELYQNYRESIYIPRRQIVYKYFDDEGNEIAPPEGIESGTIFSLGKELIKKGFNNAKDFAISGVHSIADKVNERRTK